MTTIKSIVGTVLFTSDKPLKEALEEAVKKSVYLNHAQLADANLRGLHPCHQLGPSTQSKLGPTTPKQEHTCKPCHPQNSKFNPRNQIMFKVGQKVWCLIYGQGVVTVVDDDDDDECLWNTYSVCVKFQNNGVPLNITYTADGKYYEAGNVTLFPYPVEIVKATTKPSIDWSHVNEHFKYLAMDADGRFHIYTDKPLQGNQQWTTNQLCTPAIRFASFVPGTCDWKDSLIERPTGNSGDD